MKTIFNNKKSVTLAPEALVRIGAAVLILLLIIFPACNKLYGYIKRERYSKSFETFVEEINKMKLGKETFTLNLKDKSAIIGFSKNSERYECFNCYIGTQDRPAIIVDKPKNEFCDGQACICLCTEDFKLIEMDLNGKTTKFGKCSAVLNCKTMEQRDIIGKVTIKTYSGINVGFTTLGGGEEYWKNGFLFTNGVSGANGLKLYSDELNTLIVEKRSNVIGICNKDMLDFNKDKLGFNTCIITEYDEAKKLESTNIQEAIKKYQEFVKKYKTGREVEESLFMIGKTYFNQGKYPESAEVLCQLTKDFPTSDYRKEATDILSDINKRINKRSVGIKMC